MTAWIFYLLLVFFSEDVKFSFLWLLVSFLFSGSEIAYKYKYTSNPDLEGKDVKRSGLGR
jgi:hypothetical protein